jgi:glyceraldehyde 3-phosphate dehydrogenase
MKKTRVAINGFGRIGRTVARILSNHQELQLVAVNDLAPADTLLHLLKYDTVHGRFSGEIIQNDDIFINGSLIKFCHEKSPENLPWTELEVDIVLECTGKFKTRELASLHLKAGAKRVIISAPSPDETIKMIVMGINHDTISADDTILSNASCTTNNAAPMIKVLNDLCDIESCYITTVHSFTGDQKLQDAPHSDWRRARAATQSIVPTTTGAAKALTRIFPKLGDAIGGCGIRVPVPDGSLTDITCIVRKSTTVDEVNEVFKRAAETSFPGILEYTEDPIVSSDVIGQSASCIFDAQLTSVIGKMVKIVGWYDNEVGYSHRLIDLCVLLRSQM